MRHWDYHSASSACQIRKLYHGSKVAAPRILGVVRRRSRASRVLYQPLAPRRTEGRDYLGGVCSPLGLVQRFVSSSGSQALSRLSSCGASALAVGVRPVSRWSLCYRVVCVS